VAELAIKVGQEGDGGSELFIVPAKNKKCGKSLVVVPAYSTVSCNKHRTA
jgi:hypothetical protein